MPSQITLKGQHVTLRPLTENDANSNYLNWMTNPEINRYLESRFQRHTIESLKAFIREKTDDPALVFLAIIENNTQKHIGNIKLGPIHPVHRHADIGIVIGEKTAWGRGYAKEAIKLISEYAFDELNLHKLTAGYYSPNHGSGKSFEAVGFKEIGRRHDHFNLDGQFVDDVLLELIHP